MSERRRRSPVETRERLIAAAQEELAAKGFAQCRVVDIAERAGLTTGALYDHFDNKASLLAAAVGAWSDQIVVGAMTAFGSDRDLQGPRSVDAMVALLARFMSAPSDPAAGSFLQSLALGVHDGEAREALGLYFERNRERIRDLVGELRAGQLLSPHVPDDAMVVYLEALALGAVVQEGLGLPRADRGEAETLMATVLGTLSGDGGPPPHQRPRRKA